MVFTTAIRASDEKPAPSPPDEDEIRAELQRISSSPGFDVPNRARRFLNYVIEETLAGRAERIKAFSIALAVFGRDASFDAQGDPIVRIEAGRLRRALEHYYLTAGHADAIIITIPKGAYVPVFDRRPLVKPEVEELAARVAAAAPTSRSPLSRPFPRWGWIALTTLSVLVIGLVALLWLQNERKQASRLLDSSAIAPGVPRLLVESFHDLTGTASSAVIAKGLTEEVIGQIAKFKEIIVVAADARTSGGAPENGYIPSARYALVGNVRVADETLRLSVRLVNKEDGSVVWANSYDQKLKVSALLDAESDIARNISVALAQPYGIVFQADAARVNPTPPDDWEAYNCTLYYYSYQASLSPQTHASAQACLQRAVERFPAYATAWALLSLTYIDAYRFKYRIMNAAPPLDLALDAARRAVALDNQNIRALEAEMAALFLKGDIEAALEIGARALATNPNDTELLGEYGNRLGLSGQWKRGGELIAEALTRNRGPVGYYETVLSLCLYMQGDYNGAAARIRKSNLQANPLYHLIAAAIFGQLGAKADGDHERKWVEANAGEFLDNIQNEVSARIVRPEDRAHFIDGLRKAGLALPEP